MNLVVADSAKEEGLDSRAPKTKSNVASKMMPLRILIADDDAVQRMIAARVVRGLGHEAILAQDGQEAIDLYRERGADLVLMDIMMPRVDGLQALAAIKSLAGARWVPVICLSGLEQDSDLFKALETGADDYLRKPVGTVFLEHKLRAFGRTLELQVQREKFTGELEVYRSHAEDEKRIALHLMERLVEQGMLGTWPVRYWQQAAASFCGDLVAAAYSPSGVLHVLLADATGHGLSAALNVMPVVSVFYGMTAKGFDLASVAAEINKKLKQMMPADRFVAATLAAIDFDEQLVNVWNGGNPATVLVNREGKVIHHWRSRSVPLGVMPPRLFEPVGLPYRFTEPCWLYVCSDGLIEAENAAGEQFGTDRLTEAFERLPHNPDPIEVSVDALAAHLSGVAASDDVTVLIVDLDAERAALEAANKVGPSSSAVPRDGHWRFSIKLGPAEIRRADLMPVLMTTVGTLCGSDAVRGHLMMLLTELLANSIDHGLLGLPSSLKDGPGGFERYFDERAKRLQEMHVGSLELEFEQLLHDDHPSLRVRIEDSGPGFDWQAMQKNSQDLVHGRGLALLRRLCANIRWGGRGNIVEAIVHLDE